MTKGRILHLEDEPEWIQHVKDLLGKDYDLESVGTQEAAAKLFMDMAAEGSKFDLAIIDISLVLHESRDKQGFAFIDRLQESGVMQGHSIIVLTGFPDVDQNLRVAFRDYDVVDVFDKGSFKEERSQLKSAVDETIRRLRE